MKAGAKKARPTIDVVRSGNPLSVQRPSTAARDSVQGMVFEQEARLNVTLPVSLHSKVKMRAAERRISIRAYIVELLRDDGLE